tara:strand:+ start:315 stop:470 length:156 start_codon:yes stop_codon:yes gene_type:complete
LAFVVSYPFLAANLLFLSETSFSLHSANEQIDIKMKTIDADKQSTIESLSV